LKTTERRRTLLRSIPKPIIPKDNKHNDKHGRITTEYDDRDPSLKFIIIISEISGSNMHFQKDQKLKEQKNYLI
jgi:hypothetical protein